jgi:eukaryotic-like serine/threonine-protein kinase
MARFPLLVLLSGTVVCSRAQIDAAAPWPMVGGGNLRNGLSRFVGPVLAPNSTIGVVWKFSPKRILPNPPVVVTFTTSPAVAANGDVWASSGAGTVYCAKAATGIERFNTYLVSNFEASPPTLAQGVVIVGAKSMNMWSVNATAFRAKGMNDFGYQLWQHTTASTGYDLSNAAIDAANVAYAGTGEGTVVAVDVTAGVRVWTYDTQTGHRVTTPALDESTGTLYVTTSEGTLWAITAATGALVWKQPLAAASRSGPILTAPGGTIVVGTDAGVQAFNTAGTPMWTHPTTWGVAASPAVGPGGATALVFAASWDANVYALSAATGDLAWVFSTGLGIALTVSPVVDAAGTVYIGSNTVFWGLDGSTGIPAWTFTGMPGLVFSSAAIGGTGQLYVGVAVGGEAPLGSIAALGAVSTLGAAIPAV